MKHLKPLILWSIICCFFGSCIREEVIPLKNKDKEKELVVFGFLTPSTTIQVYIGRTQPFGKSPLLREDFKELNATVILKNEEGLSKILYKEKENEPIYRIDQKDFPIEKGKTYSIQVDAPGYPTVYSTTTVPYEKAVWKSILVYRSEMYHAIKGTWDALPNNSGIDYDVTIVGMDASEAMRPEDGKIVNWGTSFKVNQDVYFMHEESTKRAILITQDKQMSKFRTVDGLSFDRFLNFKDAHFIDLISGFKGVMPQAGNITNGHGVFGGYLIDSKTIYKPRDAN